MELFPDLCDKCGKSKKDFASKKIYFQHFKNKYHSEESYVCKTCKNLFPNMRSLQVHFSAVHQSTLTYDCDKCKKSFSQKKGLIRHQLTHKEEDGVSCMKCRKSFIVCKQLNSNFPPIISTWFQPLKKIILFRSRAARCRSLRITGRVTMCADKEGLVRKY